MFKKSFVKLLASNVGITWNLNNLYYLPSMVSMAFFVEWFVYLDKSLFSVKISIDVLKSEQFFDSS